MAGGPAALAPRWWLSVLPDEMSSLLYPDDTLGASSGWLATASPRWGGGGDVYLPSRDSLELNGSTSLLLSRCNEGVFVRGENPNLV